MIKISTLIYFIVVVIVCATMYISGYSVKTPQYWIVLFSMMIARLTGLEG